MRLPQMVSRSVFFCTHSSPMCPTHARTHVHTHACTHARCPTRVPISWHPGVPDARKSCGMLNISMPGIHTHTTVLLLFWNLSGTIRVSRYQKGKNQEGKNQSGFTGARNSEWQWHLLGHMQVCTSSQTTTPTSHNSVFYRPDALPATQPTASKHCLATSTFRCNRPMWSQIHNPPTFSTDRWTQIDWCHYL